MLLVAEKKLPPALHAPHCDPTPGIPKLPMTGIRESSRLPPASSDRGQGVPTLMAGVMLSGVVPSPAQDCTVTPSLTSRYNRWAEKNTSFTKLLVTTDVSLATADCEP